MTEKIEIEKGIPLPDRRKRSIYPFAEMEFGDSFVVAKSPRAMASSAWKWAKRNGGEKKFACRTVEGGCRVWRVR